MPWKSRSNISNQNIAAAAANFLAARALVKQARAQYYPTVARQSQHHELAPVAGPVRRNVERLVVVGFRFRSGSFTDYSLPFDASWQPDFWGRVRNTVKPTSSAAQASAADLQNVRLTAQAEVAVDYFEIRAQDALKELFDETVAAYQDSLDLTQIQFSAGIASDEAVAQAETQLEATQAQDTNLGILRAQFEHAMALLVGQPASAFSMPVAPLRRNPPAIPFGVPSQAAGAAARTSPRRSGSMARPTRRSAWPQRLTIPRDAERRGGFIDVHRRTGSPGPAGSGPSARRLAETLFDAGLRRATVQQYRASYDQQRGELPRRRF